MAFDPLTGAAYPNLINVAKSLDPDGSIADVAELYSQSNPILMDIPMVEGNLPTGHRSTIRADLPTPTFRKLYQGVKPTRSSKIQVDDTIGNVEDYAAVDKDLADLNGNSSDFRLSEDKAHIEGISNTMATTLFYGDTSLNPERFLGLAPRYDALDLTASKPGGVTNSSQLKNVIDMSGAANLTSMWLVVWGKDTVFGIYPKGSKAGLKQTDQGEQRLSDSDGGWFQGYVTHYKWQMGLVVKDWRCVVRIANINVANLGDAAGQKALYQAMVKALHTVPPGVVGHPVFYCGGAAATMLDLAATEKGNLALGITDVFGQELTSFRKIPIRQCNAIIEAEAQIV